MELVYPVLIKQNDDAFLVFVPDLEIYTEGCDLYDAIVMARDAIGLRCTGSTEEDNYAPVASAGEEAVMKAKQDADEVFNYSDGILTYVDLDTEAYRSVLRT